MVETVRSDLYPAIDIYDLHVSSLFFLLKKFISALYEISNSLRMCGAKNMINDAELVSWFQILCPVLTS